MLLKGWIYILSPLRHSPVFGPLVRRAGLTMVQLSPLSVISFSCTWLAFRADLGPIGLGSYAIRPSDRCSHAVAMGTLRIHQVTSFSGRRQGFRPYTGSGG